MFQYNYEDKYLYEYHQLSNGQTAAIMFVAWDYDDRTDFYVAFAIADKKKQIKRWFNEEGNGDLDCATTGKCGVEGLVWAFQEIEKALEELPTYSRNRRANVIVMASDSRRFRIYEHFLKRLGFKKQPYQDDGMVLMKKLKKVI